MENMLLQEGDIVQVKNASLAKGTYVKLQPHTMDFLDISNPKAMLVYLHGYFLWVANTTICIHFLNSFFSVLARSLETTLRSYSCLTTGDTIMVPYNNKKYYINIVETKPSPAVSIIETDCEVDFAPPLDYKEPQQPVPSLRSKRMPPEGLILLFFSVFSFSKKISWLKLTIKFTNDPFNKWPHYQYFSWRSAT